MKTTELTAMLFWLSLSFAADQEFQVAAVAIIVAAKAQGILISLF